MGINTESDSKVQQGHPKLWLFGHSHSKLLDLARHSDSEPFSFFNFEAKSILAGAIGGGKA
jgi:hypothetical protein